MKNFKKFAAIALSAILSMSMFAGCSSKEEATTAPTEAPKATYQMDVVPYIKVLDTTLTDLEKNNPSVYGRTSLGKYPVYYLFS